MHDIQTIFNEISKISLKDVLNHLNLIYDVAIIVHSNCQKKGSKWEIPDKRNFFFLFARFCRVDEGSDHASTRKPLLPF